jgi:SAM-dependent methyltransferase
MKLDTLVEQVMADYSAGAAALATYVGDRLGLYEKLADLGPVTSTEMADATGLSERYIREWLASQAAGNYVEYDPETGRFELSPEQVEVFATPESPVALVGYVETLAALWASADRIAAAFATGEGVSYGEHDPRVVSGIDRLFAPLYRASLVREWIPAVNGLHEKLEAGIRVADIGCGTGNSTVLMALAYPNSDFVGYDLNPEAIAVARKAAADAGVADRVRFEMAAGTARIDGPPFGLVCFFDSLHDMGDPTRVVAAVVEQLAPDGIVLAVEPMAGDRLEDNLHPFGRWFYSASLFLCTPSALAAGDHALGAQAGPEVLREVLTGGGLRDVEIVLETPFNLVITARPAKGEVRAA